MNFKVLAITNILVALICIAAFLFAFVSYSAVSVKSSQLSSQYTELQSRDSILQAQLNRTLTELAGVQSNLTTTEALRDRLQMELNLNLSEIQGLNANITSLNSRINTLESEISSLTAQNAALESLVSLSQEKVLLSGHVVAPAAGASGQSLTQVLQFASNSSGYLLISANTSSPVSFLGFWVGNDYQSAAKGLSCDVNVVCGNPSFAGFFPPKTLTAIYAILPGTVTVSVTNTDSNSSATVNFTITEYT